PSMSDWVTLSIGPGFPSVRVAAGVGALEVVSGRGGSGGTGGGWLQGQGGARRARAPGRLCLIGPLRGGTGRRACWAGAAPAGGAGCLGVWVLTSPSGQVTSGAMEGLASLRTGYSLGR